MNAPAQTIAMADDPLVARLSRLETGQVSDVLDEAGLPNHALSPTLMPLDTTLRFAGRAACLRGEASFAGRHASPALPNDALELTAKAGSVLIVASGGFGGGAIMGGFVAYSLQRQGCRAFITDAPVRDADEIRGYGFPVVAAAVTPVNGARRWRYVAADEPVSLPGIGGASVTIRPGDLVLGDGDGVVVVPAEYAEQIIADSEALQRIEAAIAGALRSGETRKEAFRLNPRFDHVRPR
jgi:4-hydroxy-4-methyl-2-oxoglutarate aldolase